MTVLRLHSRTATAVHARLREWLPTAQTLEEASLASRGTRLLSSALAILSLCVNACTQVANDDAQQPVSPPQAALNADSAMVFAGQFYAWYASVEPMDGSARWAAVSADTSGWLSRELRELVRKERALATDTSSAADGLDADPFFDSQDACDSYGPGGVTETRSEFIIDVVPNCSEGMQQSTFQMILRREGSRFVIADMSYPGEFGGSLTARLRRIVR